MSLAEQRFAALNRHSNVELVPLSFLEPLSHMCSRALTSTSPPPVSLARRHSFFLPKPTTSISEYVDLLSAHGSYWTDPSFAAFLLTEVFANPASSTEASKPQRTSQSGLPSTPANLGVD